MVKLSVSQKNLSIQFKLGDASYLWGMALDEKI